MTAAAGIRRLAAIVSAVVLAGFALLLVLSLLMPADTVREAVKAEIRTVTGLDPVLRGDVAVSLFPTGTVSFGDVSLGDNRTGAPALTAERLDVRLRFFPFLIGRIRIADVSLIRPIITVDFAADGTANWSGHMEALAHALTPSPDRVGSFSEIRIADGTVILRDATRRVAEVLSDVEFALAWPSISQSFGATGQFVWHDETLDATLSFSDFLAALTGDRSGLKVRVGGAPLKFAFDGSLSYKPRLRMEGTLAADATSLRETLRWTTHQTMPGGGFGRFSLKAQTIVNGSNISLSAAHVELDGNSGDGVLAFSNDQGRTLQATLAAEGLDVTPYTSTLRVLVGGDRSWNPMPIALQGFNAIDVDLRLSAARVTLANAKLGRTAIGASLRGGNFNVTIGESQAFGGTLKGSFGLARSATAADLKAQLQFTDVDLDQCLGEILGIRRIEGKGTLSFNIDSTGSSIYELAKAVNGNATLTSRRGAITGLNVEQLLKRLERNPLAGRGDLRSGKTPYDLLAVSFKVIAGHRHCRRRPHRGAGDAAPARRLGVDPGPRPRSQGHRDPARQHGRGADLRAAVRGAGAVGRSADAARPADPDQAFGRGRAVA